MSGPSVYFSWPTAFAPTPKSQPLALPPPIKERTFRSPFGIEKNLFNFALRPEVPIIFAALYITTIFSVNAYNRSRNHKPWWIARQKPFQWFVVVHNVLLALYSIATFAAMWRAVAHTWPGLHNPNGAAGVADAFCKIKGPRGLGDAATYNTTINIWEVKNTAIRLGRDGNPDPSDVGRLWNEGLAFWGWIFYISKFYEVVDTFIIVAKGKRSATLQTYHHAGAMLCMWAGIRYMSPPIWMFVFMNSGIHAMMYTYFTLSAIGVRVPQALKRTLTSLQILQFILGASFAAVHLFVQYDIPVTTAYQVASTVQHVVSSASSAVSSITSEVSKVAASPTATATIGPLIKKLLLRAAGEEGLAERVHDKRTGQLTSPHMEEKMQHFNEQTWETKYRTDYTKVNCIDTTGQAFAIYMNLLYLAPLTFLFLRFFVKAYTQRGRPRSASQAAKQITSSEREAERRTSEAFEDSGKRIEDVLHKHGPEAAEKVRQETNDLHEQLREDIKRMKEGKFRGDRRVSDRVASFERQVKTTTQKALDKGKELVNGNGSSSQSGSPTKGERQRNGVREEDESAIEDEPEHDGEQQGGAEQNTEDEASQPQKHEPETAQKDSKPASQEKESAQSQKPSGSKESKPSGSQKDEPAAKKEGTYDSQKAKQSDAKKDHSADSQKPKSSDSQKPKSSDSQKPRSSDSQKGQSADSQKPEFISNPRSGRSSSPQKGRSSSPQKGSSSPQKGSSSSPKKPKHAAKENQPPLGSGANNQSEKKQEANLADSQATREGASDSKVEGKRAGDKPAGNKAGSDKAASDDKNKEDQGAGLLGSGTNNQPEDKQDENIADSKTLRPGAGEENEGDDEDPDAMGKSGSIIDLATEKAKDAKKEAEKADDGDKGTQS